MRHIAAILFTLSLAIPSSLAAQAPTYRGRTIAQWSDDLSHPNSVVRIEAGKMLGKLGTHAVAAVDPLIAALRDRHPDVRLHAAAALGRIKSAPHKCLAALTKVLDDRDEHVRFAAEWSLARIAQEVAKSTHGAEDVEILDALMATAETALNKSARNAKHPRQIAAAREALKSSTTKPAEDAVDAAPHNDPPIDADTAELLADLQGDDRFTQLKAIHTLGRTGHADALVEAWRKASDDDFLRWHVMQALVRVGKPAVSALAQAMRDEDGLVAQQALSSLGQMGPSAIEALPQLLAMTEDDEVSDDMREQAIWVIERLGPAAGDAVETLTQVLKIDDADALVETSIRALQAIGPAARSAEPTLLDILRNEGQAEQTRAAAATALASISPSSSEAIETLVALLGQDAAPYLVASIASGLGQYGPAASAAVPRLVELVDATSDYERQSIVRALGDIGPAAHQSTSRLIECLTEVEEFESVQVAAAGALGKLGPDAVTSLAEQLEHPHRQVRWTVTKALLEMGPRAAPAVEPLELCLTDREEDPEIRAMAAAVLGQIGPAAKSSIPTLTRLMGDVRQAVYLRTMAAVSIGQIDPEQSPTLIAAMQDSDPRVRVAAAYALQRLPSPHPDALPTLIRELESDDARGMAMRALSEFKNDSRPLLTETLNDQAKDDETRVACLNLISENGVDATEQLLEALNDERLAESAYWSLRDLGNGTIPFLVSAGDNEEAFTEEARAAIRELVEELYGGIGGGDGDDFWSGGHALMDHDHGGRAARMVTAAPNMSDPGERGAGDPIATEPEEIPRPEPEPENASAQVEGAEPPVEEIASAQIAPENGYKSVKVFYGTNRQPIEDGNASNGAKLPWYAWLVIVSVLGGMICYVVNQFRQRATGRAIVGISAIILFSLAVEATVTRIQKLGHALAKSGPAYGTEYSSQVAVGFCDVTIPDVHTEGELERPSIMRLQVVEDPEKHIVLKRVEQLERDVFFADLKGELGRRGNSMLVFIHGYNVSFESAARRTAQMSHDLEFAGAPAFYSWPSQANWRKYRVDEKNVELSINQLKTFLLELTQRSGADTINLIAHSMGNRALTNALKEIEVASSQNNKLFNQVILAAPDIDADIFRERIAPAIVPKARQITLYASSKDLALVASRKFNSGDPRAGDAGDDLVVVPGIDTIDVSAGESSLLGHSYYGDSTSVLHDISLLLRDQPAAERRFLEPFPRLEPTHWLFQPPAMARHSDFEDTLR